MGLLQSGIADDATKLIEDRKVAVDILKQHNALILAEVSAKDRRFVFDKLRKKIRMAAKVVADKPLSEIKEDMSEVGAVRQQAEALFGKFVPEPQEMPVQARLGSSQLSFLVGVQLGVSGPGEAQRAQVVVSPPESPGQSDEVADARIHTEVLQQPFVLRDVSQQESQDASVQDPA